MTPLATNPADIFTAKYDSKIRTLTITWMTDDIASLRQYFGVGSATLRNIKQAALAPATRANNRWLVTIGVGRIGTHRLKSLVVSDVNPQCVGAVYQVIEDAITRESHWRGLAFAPVVGVPQLEPPSNALPFIYIGFAGILLVAVAAIALGRHSGNSLVPAIIGCALATLGAVLAVRERRRRHAAYGSRR